MSTILVILILLMMVGALVAIETPNLLYAVVSIGAVGFLLSIAFLFLAAPDLAITQIVVEVITLVLLLKTIGASRDTRPAGHREFFGTVVTVVALLILAAFCIHMLASFPAFGQPVMERLADTPSAVYLEEGLERTGAANIVTAVLLDFRAYDTLGEAAVLFCAVVGALSVLRRKTRKQAGEPDSSEEAP